MLCFPHCAPFLTRLFQSKYGVSWCDIFLLGGATRLSYEFWQVRKWMSSPYLPPPWTSVPSVDQQWEPNQPESCIAGVTCSWQIPRKTPESFYFFFFSRGDGRERTESGGATCDWLRSEPCLCFWVGQRLVQHGTGKFKEGREDL